MRRASAIIALLAVVVYSTLATWHGAIGRTAPSALSPEAQLELALKTAICHGGAATSDVAAGEAGQTPAGDPSNGGSECPVCKGLAGVQLALLVAAELGLLERETHVVEGPVHRDIIREFVALTPRSRGPPNVV